MVLAELGQKITGALKKLGSSTIVDQAAIDEMLKEICNALVTSDVNIKTVMTLRNNIKKQLDVEALASGLDRRRIARKVRCSLRAYIANYYVALILRMRSYFIFLDASSPLARRRLFSANPLFPIFFSQWRSSCLGCL